MGSDNSKEQEVSYSHLNERVQAWNKTDRAQS
jgi:hypothetical protein